MVVNKLKIIYNNQNLKIIKNFYFVDLKKHVLIS